MAVEPWAIDPASDRPIYKQIADDLRQRLDVAEYGAGDKLPSESELMREFGASRATVRRAFDVLMGEGRVESRRGVGVFVCPPKPTLVVRHSHRLKREHWGSERLELRRRPLEVDAPEVRQEILERTDLPAPPHVASHLGIDVGTTVFVRRRRVWLYGTPTHLADSYFPLEIAVDQIRAYDTGPGGTYARIEDSGNHLAHFTEQLTFRMPTPDERHALRLGPGIPVTDLLRVAHTRHRPVECFLAVMAGDRYRFMYEIPAN